MQMADDVGRRTFTITYRAMVTADYDAKRTILSIMLETVRLNCENVEFSLRKPFVYLRDENLVPLSGATGNRTPIC